VRFGPAASPALFQLRNDQGPCLDCYRSGQPVQAADLDAAAARWPRFAPVARQAGFAAVQALPMRLREQVIGALNLFRAVPGVFDPADVRVGQALADQASRGPGRGHGPGIPAGSGSLTARPGGAELHAACAARSVPAARSGIRGGADQDVTSAQSAGGTPVRAGLNRRPRETCRPWRGAIGWADCSDTAREFRRVPARS
jgi:hypothetical protein